MHFWAFNRFFNMVGNVLGRTNYYTSYEADLGGGSTAIYSLGEADGESASPNDPLTISTLMRWGNYDTVNGASRFVAGEVPSGLSLYGNPVPTSQALPASFYLSAKPNWWGTTAWPPIGPDVITGNLAGVGGHANMIPARKCWISVMRGVVGSSGALSFNANNCYGSGGTSSGGTSSLTPPTGLTAVVQ
jgi:hypothetical protein